MPTDFSSAATACASSAPPKLSPLDRTQPLMERSNPSGVDVRGRSYTLRINYRISHQIRVEADLLLPTALADVDGNAEDRRGTVSVFDDSAPEIETFGDPDQESEAVGAWVKGRVAEGFQLHEIGVFVRSPRELRRARNAIKRKRSVRSACR
jgi:hypothetical protein